MNVSYFSKFIYFIIILYVGKLLLKKRQNKQLTGYVIYMNISVFSSL